MLDSASVVCAAKANSITARELGRADTRQTIARVMLLRLGEFENKKAQQVYLEILQLEELKCKYAQLVLLVVRRL